jgi:hypothetical protein
MDYLRISGFPVKIGRKRKQINSSSEYDTEILDHPEALVVGSLVTTESNDDPLDTIPNKFKQWTHIMSKVATIQLPEHKPYDYAIDPKQGENPPWGPCYALSEKELEVL